ncbi:Rotatin [Orchesella cincta]|uniref:Rotatin n=1 Tax=Orchesella cincta TaxID=48709 RepID=A0A1D2MGH5_ORCCI|nr:Rotatin [Orchesella cincta]
MIGYKVTETLGGGGMGLKFQMDSQRRETTLSNNGTNELIANLDHELLDVRVRALKCLLRKLEYGIISSEALKDRVDLLDRCRRWLSSAGEGSTDGSKNLSLESAEVEGIELVVQLLYELSKHREFRDLMRLQNVDSLLLKFKPYLSGDFKCQLDALVNSLVVGQFELSYEGAASEWFDNNTCPALTARSKPIDMYSSRQKPYDYDYYYKPYTELPPQGRPSPSHPSPKGSSDTSRSTPETQLAKKTNIPLGNEDGWMQNIPFFVPSVDLTGTDRRVINSTVDSLSSTSEPLVLMTVCFIKDTLTMDYPSEVFIQDSSLLLALAQVTVSRWSDHRIPYMAIQTLLKISSSLRFRFSQLNSSEQYEVPGAPTGFLDKKHNNLYYDYDGISSYSSSRMQNTGSSPSTPTDAAVENFIQLFKSFSRSLLYTSYDIHIWTVFDSFAFTMYKCISTFPVDSKSLTLSLQGVLMELAHIWERKSDFHTVVGLCLVSASVLNSMKVHNETFIVSKDVRNMLRSLSYSPVIRSGWPEVFEYFIQFSSMFDPSAGLMSEHQKDQDGDNSENHPKRRILNLLYAIQNASSHEDVLDSVDSLRDVLLPITLNLRLGDDSLAYILQDVPWRDTFYRFLCIEPTTEGDETLLGRVLDLFSYILQNTSSAKAFKWITPLCCEKSCTTLKLLANAALKLEMRHGGTALSDLVRSLLEFYSAVLTHANTLLSSETKWEIFQIYSAILNSLEEATYSNFALLTGVTKELATISEEKDIQAKIKANPVLSLALIHRVTDAVMVLAANGVLFEGFKNTSALYYLSVCVVHMLIPLMKDEACKTFKGDWIDRCGRAFQIFSMSADPRTKCQAFQVCEIFTASSYTRPIFAESSFRDSIVSLLQTAYSTFVDQKQPSFIKMRAGNTILNVLKEDEKSRIVLASRLQQEFPVLVDVSRLCSRVLWNSKISDVAKKPNEKSSDISSVTTTDAPFITPRVLTVVCKILMSFLQSLVESGNREASLHEVTSSGICQILFRCVAGRN